MPLHSQTFSWPRLVLVLGLGVLVGFERPRFGGAAPPPDDLHEDDLHENVEEVRRFSLGHHPLRVGVGNVAKGTAETGLDSDGRRYVTSLSLYGEPNGKSTGEFRVTHTDLPNGAIIPVGSQLWEIWDVVPAGARFVQPGYFWGTTTDGEGNLIRPNPPQADLPTPPDADLLIPQGGDLSLLGGYVKCKRIVGKMAAAEEASQDGDPIALVEIRFPERPDGTYAPSVERQLQVGDRFIFSEGRSLTLSVTRIVPPEPKLKMVGWVELTEEPAPKQEGRKVGSE